MVLNARAFQSCKTSATSGILSLITVPNISLDGSTDFPVETNTTIILAVLIFIRDSFRFKQEP